MRRNPPRVYTLIVAAVTVIRVPPANAQAPTGIPVVDSAAVSRAAVERALSALRRNDSATARSEIARAATSWPLQPSYIWASAVLSARARDTATAIDALRRYAALGLGRDLGTDPAFSWLNQLPEFASIRVAHDENRSVVVRSRVRATLADSTFWPEGMDYDAASKRFYVASVRHGIIAEVQPDGRSRIITIADRRPVAAILGVRADSRRGVLWATTSSVPSSPTFRERDTSVAALLRIRIRDGAVERRWDLPPSPAGHTLGDIAIGPLGDVFVTDSNDPVLYRLRPGADTLESLRSPLFRSLQGLAPTPDGDLLYLADYSHGFLRVDVRSGAVTRLEDAPNSTSLGCDGIAWDRGAIVAVQNGVMPARIMRFSLDPAGTRVVRAELIDRNTPIADEPTIGAVVGREFVYVANSQWEKFDESGKRNASKPLTAPILLSAPLP
jgi:sugar lactone lactonase YvrE